MYTRITVAGLVSICCMLPALAQTPATPSTEKMIEQLKAPRTRSLRNLLVQEVHTKTEPAQGAEIPPPAGEASSATTTAAAVQPAVQPGAPGTGAAPAAQRPSLSLLIQFDFDSARVRPESQDALFNLSQALQSADLIGSRFAIEGHTDAKGSADYNRKLSELRAQAVRDFLRGKGIDHERLVASGKGAGELANAAQPFAPENRRVRIINLDEAGSP